MGSGVVTPHFWYRHTPNLTENTVIVTDPNHPNRYTPAYIAIGTLT